MVLQEEKVFENPVHFAVPSTGITRGSIFQEFIRRSEGE